MEYITLLQAREHLETPVDITTLRRAASAGALRAVKLGDLWLTKPAWVAAYERKLAGQSKREGYPRGKRRRPADEQS